MHVWEMLAGTNPATTQVFDTNMSRLGSSGASSGEALAWTWKGRYGTCGWAGKGSKSKESMEKREKPKKSKQKQQRPRKNLQAAAKGQQKQRNFQRTLRRPKRILMCLKRKQPRPRRKLRTLKDAPFDPSLKSKIFGEGIRIPFQNSCNYLILPSVNFKLYL